MIVLPIALWSSIRLGDPSRRRETALVLVWLATVFVLVAFSHRQRWRYYLPLCTPAALLVAAWLERIRWRWRTEAFVAVSLVVAMALVTGQVTVTARQARGTDLGEIAAEITKTPGALFALDAPEIVFAFYLDTPVLATQDYATFVRRPDATDLLVPARKLVQLPQPRELRQVADGRMAGQDFALLRKNQ